jgi:hypothetical protein
VPVSEKMEVLGKDGKVVPNVYCIGDANGKYMLAHAASAQVRIKTLKSLCCIISAYRGLLMMRSTCVPYLHWRQWQVHAHTRSQRTGETVGAIDWRGFKHTRQAKLVDAGWPSHVLRCMLSAPWVKHGTLWNGQSRSSSVAYDWVVHCGRAPFLPCLAPALPPPPLS